MWTMHACKASILPAAGLLLLALPYPSLCPFFAITTDLLLLLVLFALAWMAGRLHLLARMMDQARPGRPGIAQEFQPWRTFRQPRPRPPCSCRVANPGRWPLISSSEVLTTPMQASVHASPLKGQSFAALFGAASVSPAQFGETLER